MITLNTDMFYRSVLLIIMSLINKSNLSFEASQSLFVMEYRGSCLYNSPVLFGMQRGLHMNCQQKWGGNWKLVNSSHISTPHYVFISDKDYFSNTLQWLLKPSPREYNQKLKDVV